MDDYIELLTNQKEALEITLKARDKSVKELNKTIDRVKVSLKDLRDVQAASGSKAYSIISNIIAGMDINAS